VTLPYWDWSRVAHHWWNATDSNSIWNASDHGLGGNGNPSDDECVEDGPFSKDKWRLLKHTGGGCLRRNFYFVKLDGDAEDLKRTSALPLERFSDFEEIVRDNYHGMLHNWIGGTMSDPITASNAPEMVLHHSSSWTRSGSSGRIKARITKMPTFQLFTTSCPHQNTSAGNGWIQTTSLVE